MRALRMKKIRMKFSVINFSKITRIGTHVTWCISDCSLAANLITQTQKRQFWVSNIAQILQIFRISLNRELIYVFKHDVSYFYLSLITFRTSLQQISKNFLSFCMQLAFQYKTNGLWWTHQCRWGLAVVYCKIFELTLAMVSW